MLMQEGKSQTTTVSCRRSEEVSRCVDAPLEGLDENLCTDRVCAFSYIAAEKCGPDFETSATHTCLASSFGTSVWKCKEGSSHKRVLLPVGCQGQECKDEVKTCPCESVEVTRTSLDPTGVILEECP